MLIDTQHWQERLEAALQQHPVPGASVAVLSDGEVSAFCAGVLNQDTGVEVTTDSVFQVGSVTKLYTATLVLSLIEAGLLELDEPVVRHVPELQLADQEVRQQLTARHLLIHTSGVDGDHFLDLGRGEDVLERYAATCVELAQILPLGAAWSYCNTGFALAGRLIERVTDEVFDQAMTKRLFSPLGAQRSCLLPEDALRFRAAFGHVPGSDGIELAPVPITPRTMAPAGGVMASAEDVLLLLRGYLDGGLTQDGERFLSADLVRSAWEQQVVIPDPAMGSGWGLGWMLNRWDGHQVAGHDGGTIGQAAFTRVLPAEGVAVVLLANGPGAGSLMETFAADLVEDLAGVRPPAPYTPDPGADQGDEGWFGTFERENMRIAVRSTEEGPRVTIEISGLAAESLGASSFGGTLERAADGTFLTEAIGSWTPVVPFQATDGSHCLHFGGRAHARVAPSARPRAVAG